MSEKSRVNVLFSQRTGVLLGVVLLLLLLYTRFVNLGWGLPYPFHPDERNMADALVRLHCTGWNTECFNPHFFAYGQFPLYLGYILVMIRKFITGVFGTPITFNEAVLALRIISATVSVFTVGILLKSLDLFISKEKFREWCLTGAALIFIFSPALIQFAHFGTTESLLMLFYTILGYLSLTLLKKKITTFRFSLLSGLVCGLALATKLSALSFVVLPIVVVAFSIFFDRSVKFPRKLLLLGFFVILIAILSLFFACILSPYNFLAFNDFLGSIRYESAIGLGAITVFYTRQFQMTTPVFFQFTSIVPFALGISMTLFFLAGFFFLPFKKEFNLLRFLFLLYFLPSAFLYAKWTRFMAPVFPVAILIAVLFIWYGVVELKKRFPKLNAHAIFAVVILVSSVPGIAFLSVYRNPDIRFTASQWIYKNIPANSVILSETDNTVDLPIETPADLLVDAPPHSNYQVISFNFYDLDTDPALQHQLIEDIHRAQYIIIPSRRIFANHTCYQKTISDIFVHKDRCEYLKQTYPRLSLYYDALFNGDLGFEKIKEFSAAPSIGIGKLQLQFPDESAEETWSVFDHPTIRIYKRK